MPKGELTRWRGGEPEIQAGADRWGSTRWGAGSASREPDIAAVFQAFRSNFLLIAAVTAMGAAASFFVLKSMPPQFTASALVMLDSRNTLLDETQGVFANLPIADTYIESELELIRSDAVVDRVIDREGLMDDPEFEGGSIPAGLRSMIEKRAGLSDEGRVEAEALSESVRRLQTAKEVRKRLKVERRGLSQGIVVSFRSKSQEKARDLANAFALSYVEDQLGNKQDATMRATSWLEAELRQLAKETQAAEAAVEEYRAGHTLVGEGEQGVSLQQLRLLNEQLIQAQAIESEAQVKVDQINNLRAGGRSLLHVSEIGEKKTILDLRADLAEARAEESQMASRFNVARRSEIPPYQEAYERRVSLEQALDREVSLVVEEINGQLASARAVSSSLETSLQRLRNETAEVNTASVGLNELEREAEGKRRRYEALLEEYNQADSVAASQTPHARVVSPAELPLAPSAPRKKAAFAAATILSGAFGVFLALFRETFRRTVRTPEELSATSGMRVSGVIPRFKGRKRRVARAISAVARAPETAYADAVRSLRTELSLTGGLGGVVCVTSPDTVAGKTSFAASLARSVGMSGVRTLLLDADLRKSDILDQLYPGYEGLDLVDLLRGKTTDWREAVVRGRNPYLGLIGARKGRTNEAAFRGLGAGLEGLLRELRQDYETIIVNAPPTIGAPETRMIAGCSDSVLMCVQWEFTDRRIIMEAVDLLSESGPAPRPVITHMGLRSYKRLVHRSQSMRRGDMRRLRAASI